MSSPEGLGSLLPQEAWQALLASGAVRRFAQGEILMRQGEPVNYVFILAAGRVKVSRVDADGNDLLLVLQQRAEISGSPGVVRFPGGGLAVAPPA
jgi:CRP/FNR family cyclic AMP-dependent transcriptional regulator